MSRPADCKVCDVEWRECETNGWSSIPLVFVFSVTVVSLTGLFILQGLILTRDFIGKSFIPVAPHSLFQSQHLENDVQAVRKFSFSIIIIVSVL